MSNAMEVRIELYRCGIKQYQLAKVLGITESSLSRKLREGMTNEEKYTWIEAIRKAVQLRESNL